jgi:hypothetical protein
METGVSFFFSPELNRTVLLGQEKISGYLSCCLVYLN